MSNDSLVVVGADGWIGRRLVQTATQPVTGLVRRLADDTATGGKHVLAPDLASITHQIQRLRPSAVINSAGRTRGDLTELMAANVEVTAALLAVCTSVGARLVQLGSAAEYGDPGPDPVAEDAICRPTSDYGRTKLRATELVLAEAAHGHRVLRVFNVVGAAPPMVGPVAELVRGVRALPVEGGRLELGNAATVRDFVPIDVVVQVALVIAGGTDVPPLLNVCSGRGTSFRELATALGDATGRSFELVSLDWPGIPVVVGDASLLEASTRITWDRSRAALARIALS